MITLTQQAQRLTRLGWTPTEIAAELGVPVSYVRDLVSSHRARPAHPPDDIERTASWSQAAAAVGVEGQMLMREALTIEWIQRELRRHESRARA